MMRAALHYLNLPNWTPASAGEARRSRPRRFGMLQPAARPNAN